MYRCIGKKIVMSQPNSVVESQIRPNDLMEELGIKKDAYYAYLKHLGIKAEKDSEGKAYLTEEQANGVRALRSHVKNGGKIEEFSINNLESSIVQAQGGRQEFLYVLLQVNFPMENGEALPLCQA